MFVSSLLKLRVESGPSWLEKFETIGSVITKLHIIRGQYTQAEVVWWIAPCYVRALHIYTEGYDSYIIQYDIYIYIYKCSVPEPLCIMKLSHQQKACCLPMLVQLCGFASVSSARAKCPARTPLDVVQRNPEVLLALITILFEDDVDLKNASSAEIAEVR